MEAVKRRLRVVRSAVAIGRAVAVTAGFVAAHMGHGSTLNQNIPRPMMSIMTRYEHLGMRAINFLAMREWIYRNPTLNGWVQWLSDKVMSVANGEVLTLDEAIEMATSIDGAGYTLAAGTCPCRRARNNISDEVPNNTDMVFGIWAETYLRNYPGLYKKVDAGEARTLLEEFDRHGFIHQVYGFNGAEGAAFVLCNCDKSVCIPLLAQKMRGFQSFRKGRSEAVVDEGACRGAEECGVCVERCPFDARAEGPGGKVHLIEGACFGCGVCVATCSGKATTLERKEGAELVYARNFVT